MKDLLEELLEAVAQPHDIQRYASQANDPETHGPETHDTSARSPDAPQNGLTLAADNGLRQNGKAAKPVNSANPVEAATQPDLMKITSLSQPGPGELDRLLAIAEKRDVSLAAVLFDAGITVPDLFVHQAFSCRKRTGEPLFAPASEIDLVDDFLAASSFLLENATPHVDAPAGGAREVAGTSTEFGMIAKADSVLAIASFSEDSFGDDNFGDGKFRNNDFNSNGFNSSGSDSNSLDSSGREYRDARDRSFEAMNSSDMNSSDMDSSNMNADGTDDDAIIELSDGDFEEGDDGELNNDVQVIDLGDDNGSTFSAAAASDDEINIDDEIDIDAEIEALNIDALDGFDTVDATYAFANDFTSAAGGSLEQRPRSQPSDNFLVRWIRKLFHRPLDSPLERSSDLPIDPTPHPPHKQHFSEFKHPLGYPAASSAKSAPDFDAFASGQSWTENDFAGSGLAEDDFLEVEAIEISDEPEAIAQLPGSVETSSAEVDFVEANFDDINFDEINLNEAEATVVSDSDDRIADESDFDDPFSDKPFLNKSVADGSISNESAFDDFFLERPVSSAETVSNEPTSSKSEVIELYFDLIEPVPHESEAVEPLLDLTEPVSKALNENDAAANATVFETADDIAQHPPVADSEPDIEQALSSLLDEAFTDELFKVEPAEPTSSSAVDSLDSLDGTAWLEATETANEALHAAVVAGDRSGVWRAFEANASVNVPGPKQRTALSVAIESGHIPIVKLLLEMGADVNRADLVNGAPVRYPLMVAANDTAESVRDEMMHLLLSRGAQVNQTDALGQTALMTAAEYGHLAAMRRLIDANADIDAADLLGQTALMRAQESGGAAAIALLQAAIVERERAIAFLKAVTEGDLALVKQWLAAGMSPNTQVARMSALTQAAAKGEMAIAQLLIDAGAEIDYRFRKTDPTPLFHAVYRAQTEMVRLLLEAGASVHPIQRHPVGALEYAEIAQQRAESPDVFEPIKALLGTLAKK